MKSLLRLLVCAFVCLLASCSDSESDANPQLIVEPPASVLPPDPGAAGETTLEGIDSDGDGVRDDVQRYIALQYPDSAKRRAALTQLAISLQEQLTSTQTREQAFIAALRSTRAIECLAYVDGNRDMQAINNDAISLQAEVLDTEMRWEAYRLFDEQIGGEVVELMPLDQQDASCAFDVQTLSD